MFLVEDRPIRHGVTQGPEGTVAAAVVVLEFRDVTFVCYAKHFLSKTDVVTRYYLSLKQEPGRTASYRRGRARPAST